MVFFHSMQTSACFYWKQIKWQETYQDIYLKFLPLHNLLSWYSLDHKSDTWLYFGFGMKSRHNHHLQNILRSDWRNWCQWVFFLNSSLCNNIKLQSVFGAKKFSFSFRLHIQIQLFFSFFSSLYHLNDHENTKHTRTHTNIIIIRSL